MPKTVVIKNKFTPTYKALMKRIASNLKKVRKNRKLTQEDLVVLGVERRWYQRLESGSHSISLPTLERLAQIFEVDISEFFKR